MGEQTYFGAPLAEFHYLHCRWQVHKVCWHCYPVKGMRLGAVHYRLSNIQWTTDVLGGYLVLIKVRLC